MSFHPESGVKNAQVGSSVERAGCHVEKCAARGIATKRTDVEAETRSVIEHVALVEARSPREKQNRAHWSQEAGVRSRAPLEDVSHEAHRRNGKSAPMHSLALDR